MIFLNFLLPLLVTLSLHADEPKADDPKKSGRVSWFFKGDFEKNPSTHIQPVDPALLLPSTTPVDIQHPDLPQPEDFMPTIAGTPPEKIAWIIDQLIMSDLPVFVKNRLILHGPPGNGKTMWAREIARATGRYFIALDGPSIVNRYQGSGAERIESVFSQAQQLIDDGRKVVIFIDEIDAIAASNETDQRADFKAALQQLWLSLDKYKHDGRIFIVVATNHFKKLDKTFLDRFGNNIVEIKNPNAAMRKAILQHYLSNYGMRYDADTLDFLVKKSQGVSIRTLEDFATDLYMAQSLRNRALETIDKDIALRIFTDLKKKAEKETDSEWKTKLERASLYIGIIGGSLGIIMTTWQIAAYLAHGYVPYYAQPKMVGGIASSQ